MGFLGRAARLSVALIPACDACSVSVATDGKVRTGAFSDAFAERVDQHQYDLDQGPCLEAIDTGTSVRSGLFAEETRWRSSCRWPAPRAWRGPTPSPWRRGSVSSGLSTSTA